MQHQLFQSIMATVFTICLFSISQAPVQAAPGNLGHIPLFVAPPTPPNIFFMLDDSGSMHWSMPSDGVSSTALITRNQYDTIPDDTREWNVWCLGANFMAYDPTVTYKPWAANQPGTTTPFPDQTNLLSVWADPYTLGVGSIAYSVGSENENINGEDSGSANLVASPIVTWTDTDNDGEYDVGECPTSFADTRVRRADSLTAAEQINFANWFSYYRLREHATKAAVTQVVSSSSARMGMATLHHNNGVGIEIKDMTDATNKENLLKDIVKIDSRDGTPLRRSLNNVGKYFDQSSSTPSGLNISTSSTAKPILSAANGGECQQNFTMLMTDGQWNGSAPSGINQQDNTVDNNYVYPAHKDTVSKTLADVAMKWYKTDLAPSLANKVPVQDGANAINLDENNKQHMVTFGVAFGPNGTLTADPVDRTAAFVWPVPTAGSTETVDDLRHAAYNGRGKFLSAKNPQTLIKALQNVITDIESRQGSAAAVSFNTTSLVAGTSVFFASFDTTAWKGDVRSISIDPVSGVLGATNWRAASVLDSKSNVNIASRAIYTWGLDSVAAKNGVLFNWSTVNPQPATVISDDFKKNQDTSVDVAPFTDSQARMNYVRGDTSNDGVGLIRNRSSRLGDIINSAPYFVGSPVSNWPNSGLPFSTYATLYSTYQSALETTPRQGMVYVGANDGMLHGFKEDDGEEVFAYVPSSPASSSDNDGLHYLTESDYQHRYYVDGSPISADVYLRAEALGTQAWHTILVGSLRGGGQGLYALDVTDPSQFLNTQAAAKDLVMWEFTNQDDADLGFTFSDPQITMMNNGEWAVIIGNGYNATGTDTAKLMILFIERGIDGVWAAGDYIKLDTGVGTAINKNGLSTPTLIDLDGDGKTDRIYAGDLHGNMWAFDVSNGASSNWEIAHEDGSANKIPLFTAAHHAGNPPVQVLGTPTPQPITMKPLVVKPSWITDTGLNTPNVMVYFGTGQYIATGDASNTDQQTFYGVWDTGIVPVSGASVLPTNLVEQTFLPGFPVDARVLSHNSVSYAATPSTGDQGWFVNLPESGERVVVNAFVLQGLVFFNTLAPSSAPCSAGGSSWLMAVNQETGANPDFSAFDITGDRDLDTADVVTDGAGNQAYAAGVAFLHGIASATAVITNDSGASFGIISGTDSNDPHDYVLPGGGGGGTPSTGVRRSWLQLFN
jgi:type IV pilus assembly protein PilY1